MSSDVTLDVSTASAAELDAADPLASFRDEFEIPDVCESICPMVMSRQAAGPPGKNRESRSSRLSLPSPASIIMNRHPTAMTRSIDSPLSSLRFTTSTECPLTPFEPSIVVWISSSDAASSSERK